MGWRSLFFGGKIERIGWLEVWGSVRVINELRIRRRLYNCSWEFVHSSYIWFG